MENVPIRVSNLALGGWWGSAGVLGCFEWDPAPALLMGRLQVMQAPIAASQFENPR